jgi:hypothetical protein
VLPDQVGEVSRYLGGEQNLARVFSHEERNRDAPRTLLRDAPLVEIVEFFCDIQIVTS